MRLAELFDRPIKTRSKWIGNFRIGRLTRRIKLPTKKKKVLTLRFFINPAGNSAEIKFEVNGVSTREIQGDEILIFSTVIDQVKQFLQKAPQIDELVYTSVIVDPSRISLYKALLRRFDGYMGFNSKRVEKPYGHYYKFIFRKDNKKKKKK